MKRRFFLRVPDGNESLRHHPGGTRTHSLYLFKLRDRLEIYLVPGKIHQDGIASRHPPLDEVLPSLVTNLIKLAESLDLASRDPLFTMSPLRLLVITIRKTAFRQNCCNPKAWGSTSCGNRGRIKAMLLW